MSLKKSLLGIKKVFSDWRYFSLGILFALLFYFFNVFIVNYGTFIGFASSFGLVETLKIFFNFSIGFKDTIAFYSFYSIIILSILFGMLISILIYKIGNIKTDKGVGFIGALGITLGILAPGCAACGVGLITAIGISGAVISFFPFKGFELSLIAIILLGFSVQKISKGLLDDNSCSVKIEKNGKRKK